MLHRQIVQHESEIQAPQQVFCKIETIQIGEVLSFRAQIDRPSREAHKVAKTSIYPFKQINETNQDRLLIEAMKHAPIGHAFLKSSSGQIIEIQIENAEDLETALANQSPTKPHRQQREDPKTPFSH